MWSVWSLEALCSVLVPLTCSELIPVTAKGKIKVRSTKRINNLLNTHCRKDHQCPIHEPQWVKPFLGDAVFMVSSPERRCGRQAGSAASEEPGGSNGKGRDRSGDGGQRTGHRSKFLPQAYFDKSKLVS